MIPLSPWLIWGVGAAFFLTEYSARVAPSVMTGSLMRDFHVTSVGVGALSAVFYYSYVAMQLPVGTLVDRFGPQRLLIFTALLCALGSFIFGVSTDILFALLGRFLIGFGGAFAFVGTLKLASVWFSAKRFGLLAGLTQALGMLGAALGEAPNTIMVQHLGWRGAIQVFTCIFIFLAFLIALLVRDRPICYKDAAPVKKTGLINSLMTVARNPQSWINGLVVGLLYAPTAAFAELWGASYIQYVYHFSERISASLISMIFIGWAVGGPLLGWVCDRINKRKPCIIFSIVSGFIFLSIILYCAPLPIWLLFCLTFLYGATNAGVAIAYVVAAEINPKPISGTSMAFANMSSVLIGSLFQPIVGFLIHHHSSGLISNGIPVYSSKDFEVAMSILPICFIASFIAAYFLKESAD